MSEIPRAAHSQRGRHREPRPTLEQWARAYQRRGWTVVPVRHRGKAPTQRGWAARRGPLGDAALREHFGGATLNIGIATGAASGRLVDVDLDCDEAVIAASTLLPCTGLRSGRTSRPQSHYWYTLHPSDGLLLGGIPTLRFSIPGDLFSDGRPRFGERAKPAHSASAPSEHEAMLVELRYDGHQTIVEPSLHPSGEPVEWQVTDDAKEVTALALLRAVGRVAAAALLARYWAPRGHRDECALALTGALLRMGWTTADTDVFVRAVARAAGDDEWRRRAKAGALATRLSDLPNAPTRGWPSVAELLAAPSGERVATLARVWLGYGSGSEPAPRGPRVESSSRDRAAAPLGEGATEDRVGDTRQRAALGAYAREAAWESPGDGDGESSQGGRGLQEPEHVMPAGLGSQEPEHGRRTEVRDIGAGAERASAPVTCAGDSSPRSGSGADVPSAATACAGPSMTRSGAAWMGTPTPRSRAGDAATTAPTTPFSPRGEEGRGSEDHAWGVVVADVPASEVAWLWPGRIPLGMITLLDGDPGLGKSLVCADLAARVTRGWAMPDGTGAAEPAGVILLSNEDSLSATIRPRLEAAGADLNRVIAEQTVTETDPTSGEPRQRPLVLPADVGVLEGAIRRIGARLLIIDPLMAYLSANVNTWRDQDVRAALAPLARVAETTGVAILVLRHLNKATALANALYRGGGSIGIIGAARSALLVGQAPDNEAHRILAVNKSNLAGLGSSLRYSVECAAGAPVPSIVWRGEAAYTARALLTGHAADEEPASAVRDAESFLVAQLGDGPLPSGELNERAAQAGFAAKTVERARKNARVGTFRVGFGKGSKLMARLPYTPRNDTPGEAKEPADDGPADDGPADEPAPPASASGEPADASAPSVPGGPAGEPAPKRPRRRSPPAGAGLQLVMKDEDEPPFAGSGEGESEDGEESAGDAFPYPGLYDEDDEDDEAWDAASRVPMPCTLRGERHEFAGGTKDDAGRPVCDTCGWAALVPAVPAGVMHGEHGESEAAP